MKYELALKLKEAGFPLKCHSPNKDDLNFGLVVDYTKDPSKIMYPLLDELIEACGDKFEELVRLHEGAEFEWYAGYDDLLEPDRSYGTTPEEAVANLWLQLNT